MNHSIFVVERPDGALLVEYRTWCNDWVFPGGAVEEGEYPILAAVRECEEETGIVALSVKKLEIPETRTSSGRLIHAYLIRNWEGEVPSLDFDNQAPLAWLAPEEMIDHDLESQRYVAEAVIASRNADSAYV